MFTNIKLPESRVLLKQIHTHHFVNGGLVLSRTLSQGLSHCSSRPTSPQNPSGSFRDRSNAFLYSSVTPPSPMEDENFVKVKLLLQISDASLLNFYFSRTSNQFNITYDKYKRKQYNY